MHKHMTDATKTPKHFPSNTGGTFESRDWWLKVLHAKNSSPGSSKNQLCQLSKLVAKTEIRVRKCLRALFVSTKNDKFLEIIQTKAP